MTCSVGEAAVILVVDDDARTRRATARALEPAGYRVLQAAGGVESLALARNERPHLVLLNEVLPDVDGPQVLASIRADPGLVDVAVVLVGSVRTQADQRTAGLDAGAQDYVARPISDEDLLARVRAQLRNRELTVRLRDSETRLRELFERQADAVLVVDAGGIVRFVNPAAEQLLARSAAELIGAPLGLPLDGRELVEVHLPRVGQPSVSVLAEMRVTATDWEGAPASIVSLRDVSSLWRAEAAAREVAERLQHYLQVSPAVTYVLVPRGDGFQVEWVSDNIERLFGYSVSQVSVEGWWRTHLHPDHHDRMPTVPEALFETGAATREYRFRRADGAWRWMYDQMVLERDAAGAPARVIGAWLDITERREAQAALATEQQRSHLILNSISEGVYGLDADGRIVLENRAALAMFGCDAGDLLGRRGHAAIHHHRADGRPYPEQQCPILRTLRDGERRVVDTDVFFRADGSSFPVEYACAPVRDAAGAIKGAVVSFRDISARLAAVAALRDSESRFRHAVEQSPFPALIHAEDGAILAISSTWTELTGYDKSDLPDIASWTEKAYGARKESVQRDVEKLYGLEGCQYVGEYRIRCKDGRERVWDFSTVGLGTLPDGRRAVLSMAVDVTERKRSEQTLRESEAYQRAIIECSPLAIFSLDFDGRVRSWNAAAEALFGWSAAEVHGRPLPTVPADQQDEIERMRARVRSGESISGLELKRLNRRGELLDVRLSAAPIRDADGGIVGIMATMEDIGERRALEEQLRRSQRLEAVGQLTGGVAHDFNNLLTVILGNAELLVERAGNDAGRLELAQMIVTAAQRGADLTQRLLAFARRQALEPQAVDVGELLAGMEEMLRRTLGEQVQVSLSVGEGLWPALVDPGQLESAVLNLCLNARDAMPGGGRLAIEIDNTQFDEAYAGSHAEVRPGEYVRVAVSDTGVGMSAQTLERVFEPFFTTKETSKGTGLGLAMVYGFAKQSGGHVSIYSESGEGTAVRLYLPRAAAATVATGPAPAAPVCGGTETVLLVEDDALVRRYTGDQLRALGYRVLEAGGGAEALEVARAHEEIDLLFTDVIMPGGMNGRVLADTLQGLRPGLKVLFSSGYTENVIVHEGRLDPGVHLLAKPYRRADLARRLREALDD